MGYLQCLEKAGAKVLDFKEFGSYQGDWLAFVQYMGETGIVQGSYGSCSGCDAFLAEFDGSAPEKSDGKFYINDNIWDDSCECAEEEYNTALKEYDSKLANFGRRYLESEGRPDLYDKSHYEKRLLELDSDDWFDEEEKEYIEWAINRNW